MRVNKEMTSNLARSADLLNTVGGGTIYPTFESTKEVDHYRMEVSIPSVSPENIKLEVTSESLLIFQKVEMKGIKIPNLLAIHKLSANINIDSITAGYEDDLLTIIMPFNELTNGSRREIDILKH